MSVERHTGVEIHKIHEQSVGAYLLGALEEPETRTFEEHLEECPVCREEIERLRPAVDALARSVPPLRAPPGLKTALMAEVESDLRDRGELPAGPSFFARLRERFAVTGESLAGMRPAVAWVSAAFVLLVGGVAGFGITKITSDDSGARTLAATVDQRSIPAGSGSLLVPGDTGEGAILRVHGMPTLDSRSVYQVWVQRGDETISQSLFSVGADGDGAAAVSEDLDGADAVMVTREPAGGARAPGGDPIITVPL